MRNNKLHNIGRLLACLILTILTLAGGFGSSLYAREYPAASVMSEGKWAKISIKNEGMQILTPAFLKTLGFNDPAKVHVYGYGGYRLSEILGDHTPYDLPQQPVVRMADGSIIFYGAGLVEWSEANNKIGYHHRQNTYSTKSTYLLSDRAADDIAPEPLTTPIEASATPVTSFTQLMLHEQEITTPANSGADLLGEDFRTNSQRSFSFPVTDAASDDITFRLFFAYKSSAQGSLSLTSGGKNIASTKLSSSGGDYYYRNNYLTTTASLSDRPTADLIITYTGGGLPTVARLDFIQASYKRRLRLNAGQLQFRHKAVGAQVLCLEGASSATRIWDVTDPAAPRPITFELQGTTARFAPASSGLRTYMAFNPDAVKTAPISEGNVACQNIHGMEVPDMVIISLEGLKSQAERVADYHREHDGMIVHILTPEAIYNEFSSGRPDGTAFRKMLKMFYDREKKSAGNAKLKYCLLFGRPSYDNRMLAEGPAMSGYPRLISWQNSMNLDVDSRDGYFDFSDTYSLGTDCYFAMLEDTPASGFSLGRQYISIGIGRMPVKNLNEARQAVDKLLGYMADTAPGAWRSHVMLIADDADTGSHLEQTEGLHDELVRASNGNGADFMYEKLYLDSYPLGSGGNSKTYPQAKERMFKMLDDGVSLVTYIGHANPTSWTHESLMTYSDINSLTYKHLPIIFHASCEFVRFDDDAQSGAETMWLNPTSGAIAFIAANRKAFISQNRTIARGIGASYFNKNEDGTAITIGEVYRRALNYSGQIDGGNTNKNCFVLVGDPAMRIPSPDSRVSVETLAGVDLRQAEISGNLPVVPARSQLKVSGTVCTPDGAVDASFNGTLTATLYDAERVITTYGHPSANGKTDGVVKHYNDRKNRLAIASFPVKEGRWEATLYLPEEIDDNFSPAFLSMYAASADGKEAIGSTKSFYVYGYDDTLEPDTEAPEISMAAIGHAGFRPGDIVAPSTVFLAKVRDDSGINISSAGIGKQMAIIIDGRKVYDDVADYFATDIDDPTGGSVSYPVDGLEEGEHELVFQVFDNAGNCSKVTLPFKVGGSLIPNIDLRTDASPASTQATIYVTTAHQPSEAVIEVFDLSGRRLWSCVPDRLSQSMNVTWDLRATSGERVPRGIYLYSATVVNPDGTKHRRTRKLAVTAE